MWRALAISTLLACPLAAQDFFTLKGHGGPIMDIAVSPADQIATASFDNSVGVWAGHKPNWFEGHRAAVNTVGFWTESTLISGGDDNSLWLWSQATGTGRQIGKHTAKIVDIAFAPDNETIAAASWDGTVGLYLVAGLESRPIEDLTVLYRPLKGHKSGVNTVAFSRKGRTIFSGSVDGTIRSWRFAGSELVSNVMVKHGFGVNEIIVNEAAGWLAYGATDGATRLIDLETGQQIADFTLDRRPVLAMAWDALSETLAVGDGQGYIMLVDTGKMRITHDFKASRSGPIWALAFSKDGRNLHAGGIEDVVYSWPVATMTEHEPMSGKTRSFLENPETLSNGERQFKRKCSICHTLTRGSARKAGPSLYKLFGRRAGTVPDYTYSDTLDGSQIVWSADTIDALFDLGPDHYIPGTKMPMQRIAKRTDRDDLVDYLRRETAVQEN